MEGYGGLYNISHRMIWLNMALLEKIHSFDVNCNPCLNDIKLKLFMICFENISAVKDN